MSERPSRFRTPGELTQEELDKAQRQIEHGRATGDFGARIRLKRLASCSEPGCERSVKGFSLVQRGRPGESPIIAGWCEEHLRGKEPAPGVEVIDEP